MKPKSTKAKLQIQISPVLYDCIIKHTRFSAKEDWDFFTKAFVNQLEREGNYEIRNQLEKEFCAYAEKEY